LKQAISPWLRRLDFLPARWAWAVGLGFGALAGAVLAGPVPRVVGVPAFLALLGAAAVLAWSSEPIAIEISAPRHPREPAYTSRFLDLVSIPGGTFQMGSPESEEGRLDREGPVHQVTIFPFACTRHPVTRRLYAQIMGNDPGWPWGEADYRPVNNVSWHDAVIFCNELSNREGLTLCYKLNGEEVTWNRAADGYRLLTEAEWEYACRAGTATQWSFGADEAALGDYAWFEGNAVKEPHPVGGKKPNPWHLNDMHGNIEEWCWDWFGQYVETPEIDPTGPPDSAFRVLRGGAFYFPSRFLRSASRSRGWPSYSGKGVGFRCACGPSPP
jgi:formylglycine-generating enzyme required for sulfatase activity